MSRVVAIVGSRSVPYEGSRLVSRVSGALTRTGYTLAVGCSYGADAAVLKCVFSRSSPIPVSSVQCFAIFGQGGAGQCQVSSVYLVSCFAALGGSVSWWSGGGSSVPVRARLVNRTRAVVSAASVSVVAFFSSPSSRGTLRACQFGIDRGLTIIAFPLGFSGSSLPSLGAGSWVPVGGSGVWADSWRWEKEAILL